VGFAGLAGDADSPPPDDADSPPPDGDDTAGSSSHASSSMTAFFLPLLLLLPPPPLSTSKAGSAPDTGVLATDVPPTVRFSRSLKFLMSRPIPTRGLAVILAVLLSRLIALVQVIIIIFKIRIAGIRAPF